MADGLTTEARDFVMRQLFGPGCEIGLTRLGTEIADDGYARQPVTFSEPQDGRVQTTADVTFGPWAEDMPSAATGVLVARGDMVIGRYPFPDLRERQRRGDELVIRAGAFHVDHLD